MCLITPFKDKKVATQDMIVYKALDSSYSIEKTIYEEVKKKKWFGLKTETETITSVIEIPCFRSQHMGYRYVAGDLQPKVVIHHDDSYCASSDEEWERVVKYAEEHFGFVRNEDITLGSDIGRFAKENENFICVAVGYHSYADKEVARLSQKDAWLPADYVVKCIIPAGSEYYEGLGFLVSDQIIVTDEYISLNS